MAQEQDQLQQQDGIDHFDCLPDAILLLILDKIFDAKSLCRCLLVSKRFESLATQVTSMSIRIGAVPHDLKKSRSSKGGFARLLIHKLISKPLHFLHHIVLPRKPDSRVKIGAGVQVFRWMTASLKNFAQVESLKLELSCSGGTESEMSALRTPAPLLRWNAEFGKELRRCVILGASSFEKRKFTPGLESDPNSGPGLSNDDLKSRIVWIISCLLAASARHCLLKKMAISCPRLRDAVIVDSSNQGKLLMKGGDIKELVDSMNSSQNSDEQIQMWHRTCVPDLMIKLLYVNELELPCSGYVMKGATLVAVRPLKGVDGKSNGDDETDSFPMGYFESDDAGDEQSRELFAEAVKEIIKNKDKKICKLEMNSF